MSLSDVEVLLSQEQIAQAVAQLGAQITADYTGKDLTMISVLKGSVVFMADLMRAIDLPLRIDFMSVSSYGAGVKTSGVVKIQADLTHPIAGQHLLIVEDILDSGLTLSYLTQLLRSRGPASIRLVTLLDKPQRRQVDITADYIGFAIPDVFVVGYGLDYDERYRNLPFVGKLA